MEEELKNKDKNLRELISQLLWIITDANECLQHGFGLRYDNVVKFQTAIEELTFLIAVIKSRTVTIQEIIGAIKFEDFQ